MTAVDHAELKRLADALRVSWSDRGWTPAKKVDGLLKEARQAADALDALLSEIEGLKSYAKDAANEALEYRRQLDALHTQAPDSWRPDREAVRKAVDWLADEIGTAERGKATTRRVRKLYAKDEAVNRITAALRPQTAESGK